MFGIRGYFPFMLAMGIGGGVSAADVDPVRAALEESRANNRGLVFFVRGQSISGVVVRVDERHVVARSMAQGHIVIRLDAIDAVSGFVNPPAGQ